MSTKKTDTCLQKAGDDEPIFVLRAQDRYAPLVVRIWALVVANAGAPSAKCTEALDLAAKMEAWQRQHDHKVPD